MMETKPEPRSSGRTATVPLLTYVLSYDELGRDVTAQFWLDDVGSALAIARATSEGVPPHLDGGRLVIADGFMSSDHARLERRGDATVVIDAGSRNGTWVNGRRVVEHRLADGDVIEVGHSLLCYRVADQTAVAALSVVGDSTCLGPTRTVCPEQAALGAALRKIGPSREPVLILAETGSGKEEAARAIHRLSCRTGEFRAVDCGAVPDSLFESTFFGHKKGAFTGAERDRTGEIAAAHAGTLFLDEVGNMAATSQAKLLRVIESDQVTPVGAAKPERADVRWLAATNADLFNAGDFREDLLRRLAGYVAHIPPLRQRREDLGILTAHVLAEAGAAAATIAPVAARALFCSPLPGNIRQLRATLRSAALLAPDGHITEAHVPATSAALVGPGEPEPAKPRRAASATAEQVAGALRRTRGNVVRAAELLGTNARQLYRWIERYQLSLEDFRD